MKLSKEEILAKISEKVQDEDLAIELMEDIADSMEVTEVVDNSEEIATLKSDIELKDAEIVALKEKYKARFLSGEEIAETIPENIDEDVEEEEEVIDIKEI